jgi:hypothetical protein
MTNNTINAAEQPMYSKGDLSQDIPHIVRCVCGTNVVLWHPRNECVGCGITVLTTEHCRDEGEMV